MKITTMRQLLALCDKYSSNRVADAFRLAITVAKEQGSEFGWSDE